MIQGHRAAGGGVDSQAKKLCVNVRSFEDGSDLPEEMPDAVDSFRKRANTRLAVEDGEQAFQKIAIRVEAVHRFGYISIAWKKFLLRAERDIETLFPGIAKGFVRSFFIELIPGQRGLQLIASRRRGPARFVREWFFFG